MKYLRCLALALSLGLTLASGAFAVEPDEILDDAALEARARAISKQVRCVVCQNQDIDSSNAGVARDLRILVRERLVAGDSDQQVLDYLTTRYGDYVLFKPPWKATTYALWLGPFVILLIGGFAVAVLVWRSGISKKTAKRALTPDEEAEVHALLKAHNSGEEV